MTAQAAATQRSAEEGESAREEARARVHMFYGRGLEMHVTG